MARAAASVTCQVVVITDVGFVAANNASASQHPDALTLLQAKHAVLSVLTAFQQQHTGEFGADGQQVAVECGVRAICVSLGGCWRT